MKSKNFSQVLKFIVVGVLNTAIDLAVLNFLIFVFHTGQTGFNYALFKAISFLAALINSYLMNRSWTFTGGGSRNPGYIEFGQFFGISVIGLGINVVAASAFIGLIHPLFGLSAFWPSIAALAGTAFGLIWNFIGYKYFVFLKEDSELLPPA